MLLLDAETLAEYLRERGLLGDLAHSEVRPLTGGVSNVVFRVRSPGRPDFVVKQAREQLRVPDPWFCSVDRLLREIDVLRTCAGLLRDGNEHHADMRSAVPDIVYEDRENYLYVMSAAPLPHRTWKDWLLEGHCEPRVAQVCGTMMAAIHAGSWGDPDLAKRYGDREFFQNLRLQPYYEHAALHHSDMAAALRELIASVDVNATALVHGDFSPKNLLCYEKGLMLLDFEVGHYGDPAFDLGFFLSHLALKAVRAEGNWPRYMALIDAFWQSYSDRCITGGLDTAELSQLEQRAVSHFAACALARIDGKSTVDYLSPAQQEQVRRLTREILLNPQGNLEAVWQRWRS